MLLRVWTCCLWIFTLVGVGVLVVLAWRASIKGATCLPSGIWWWMNKGWGWQGWASRPWPWGRPWGQKSWPWPQRGLALTGLCLGLEDHYPWPCMCCLRARPWRLVGDVTGWGQWLSCFQCFVGLVRWRVKKYLFQLSRRCFTRTVLRGEGVSWGAVWRSVFVIDWSTVNDWCAFLNILTVTNHDCHHSTSEAV